ncbi:DUF3137 domain-containing protein [Planctomycetota bacterium]
MLRVQSDEWEITLDTYTVSTGQSSVTYTRMRAPFVNKDGLYFKIYREGLFAKIGKIFGTQDIKIGDPFFDDAFMIKGNNEDKIKLLLEDDSLKKLIDRHQQIYFEVKDDEGWFSQQFPGGVDMLNFYCYGVIKDEDRLKDLFELFALALQRLVQIDSAYEEDPNIKLK